MRNDSITNVDRQKKGTTANERSFQYLPTVGGSRTHDPLLRRQLLYPTELRRRDLVQGGTNINKKAGYVNHPTPKILAKHIIDHHTLLGYTTKGGRYFFRSVSEALSSLWRILFRENTVPLKRIHFLQIHSVTCTLRPCVNGGKVDTSNTPIRRF